MTITLMSFGYRYGLPAADTILDMRCLDNPFWCEDLRDLCGLDAPVRDYIFSNPNSVAYAEELLRLFTVQISCAEARRDVQRNGCGQLHVAIGCTGGRHRSVAMAEYLAASLKARGHDVELQHRDLNK